MHKKFLSIVFALSIVAPSMAESILISGMGITQSDADGLYGSLAGEDQWGGTQDFSLATLIAKAATADTHVATRIFGDGRWPQLIVANAFTAANTFTAAGTPISGTNTTDAADNVVFELYTNRGTGAADDTAQIDIYFDDDVGTKLLPGSLFFRMTDAGAKGGVHGGFGWQAGPTPTENFFCDGESDRVLANRWGLLAAPNTGIVGGVDELNLQTQDGAGNPQTRVQISDGSTHWRLLTGYNGVFDDELETGGPFAVGSTVAAMENSAILQATSTTLGSISAPRMTTAQATAIASKDTGIQVDDTDLNALKRWNGAAFEVFSVDVPIIKSGTVAGGSFAGNPKIFTVTFGTAFPDTNYAVTANGEDSRTLTFQTKLAGSFVINTNANLAIAGDVDWTATAHNDP